MSFILVDKDGSLSRSSEFMRTCHNMNIIFQTTGVYSYSLNGESEIPNKTIANIKRFFLLNSSHKKELCCFAYKYAIWLFRWTYDRLSDVIPYFLGHGSIPSYKHIKIWGLIFYIINGRVTIKNLDDGSHRVYFMVYAATAGVILYWDPDQHFVIHISHICWFGEYNSRLSV